MQEHEYKARDKTVQKMSRDGLREENLRNKEEKRITGRDMDTEVSRSEKKDELDFSKRRRDHINEKRKTEHPEQSSQKTRYSRESVLDEESEQDIDGELDGEQVADESTAATKSTFRSESIRENGLIWKRLWTAGISVRKRWSEIMRQKKDGRKRRLPKKARRQREKLPGTGKLQKWQKSLWMDFRRRSKANRSGNVC